MYADFNFVIQAVLEASIVVKIVMALLLLFSIYSWGLILSKLFILSRARAAVRRFERNFWKNKDLTGLYNRISGYRREPRGLEHVFFSGYVEFAKLRRQTIEAELIMHSMQQAMRVAISRELASLERSLSNLATIGSVSPYVGLFGTVWGIMHSFHALRGVQHATLAMVAPGISEALIVTAFGLFVAIPAVIAYNNYLVEIENLADQYDNFAAELAQLLQRQLYAKANS